MVIDIENVHFTYGCHPVLDGISLQVDEGEVVGVTGPNGAGKSTLIQLIMGLIQPQSGEIRLFGVPVKKFKRWHAIGYVAQKAALFNRSYPATVYEVVLSGRASARGLFRFLGREDKRLAVDSLAKVGMEVYWNKPIGELSGGQQQRVMIARALAVQPRLLIMDEPTVGVDAASLEEIGQILQNLRADGITMVLVSHEAEWLAGIASKRVCLDRKICSCNCHVLPGDMAWRDCRLNQGEKINLGCADSLVGG